MNWWKQRRDTPAPESVADPLPAAEPPTALLVFGVDPTDPESLDYAGVQYAHAGQHAEAAAAILASAQLGFARGAYNYGIACEAAGRLDEARHWWEFAAQRGHAGAANGLGGLIPTDQVVAVEVTYVPKSGRPL
ncbi:MAG: hypothetical protein ABIM89_16620 [Mycobacteriales bacterium]